MICKCDFFLGRARKKRRWMSFRSSKAVYHGPFVSSQAFRGWVVRKGQNFKKEA